MCWIHSCFHTFKYFEISSLRSSHHLFYCITYTLFLPLHETQRSALLPVLSLPAEEIYNFRKINMNTNYFYLLLQKKYNRATFYSPATRYPEQCKTGFPKIETELKSIQNGRSVCSKSCITCLSIWVTRSSNLIILVAEHLKVFKCF